MDKTEKVKTVKTFAIASFLNDLGSDMIFPIWPLFVTSFLGANMEILGFLDGLGDALVSLSSAASGYISDRIRKRKIFVWLGYILSSLSRVGYSISTVWQHLIPFRIMDRAGKIRGAPRDAMVADVSTKADRGTNFGILRSMDNLGAVFGIIASILLFGILGYKKLFFIAAIPSAIGAILIFFVIKEKKPKEIRIHKPISLKKLDNNLKLFLVLSAIFALGSFSYSFLLIFAKEFGYSAVLVPVLYLIFTLVAALLSYPFGRLSDSIGRKNVLFISGLFWVGVCLSFIIFHNHIAIIIAFILYGLHKAALEPSQKTIVSELAPKGLRASTLGGFQMVVGLFALPASLLAGILWDKVSVFAPFYLSLGLTIVSLVLLLFVRDTRD